MTCHFFFFFLTLHYFYLGFWTLLFVHSQSRPFIWIFCPLVLWEHGVCCLFGLVLEVFTLDTGCWLSVHCQSTLVLEHVPVRNVEFVVFGCDNTPHWILCPCVSVDSSLHCVFIILSPLRIIWTVYGQLCHRWRIIILNYIFLYHCCGRHQNDTIKHHKNKKQNREGSLCLNR